ncbi:hypothetical protein N0V94_004974 [Neodidymelliopsis sp. IMI 364377]|nr:hypothetical protein N0V94_004974 [Neodidymelliopsis sp. IMI 364377]
MRHSIAILPFLAGAALADDVLSFVFPGGYDGVQPVATVLSANPSTTAALMACPTDTAADECGWGTGASVQIISGTRYEATMTGDSFSMSYGCDYNSKAVQMTCTAEMTGEEAQTAILSGSDVAFITATVVQGAELLSGGASATASASASASASAASQSSTAAASSGLRTSASASASGTAAAGSHASNSASTATASGSVPQSTGAAAKFGIEGAALIALAGAAALNVL